MATESNTTATKWGALREGIGPSGTFLIFAAILVPQVFMVWKFMPETAGRSLEEIEQTYYGAES